MNSKFKPYEIVKIVSNNIRLKKVWGREGPISGISQSEENGSWGYSITFPEATWFVFEKEIQSTGKFANPDDYKPVGSIRVQVQPDGSGKIVDDN